MLEEGLVLKIGGSEPLTRSMLRMVVGFTFSMHGFQKLLGLFGGIGGRGAAAPLFSLMWTAGWSRLVARWAHNLLRALN